MEFQELDMAFLHAICMHIDDGLAHLSQVLQVKAGRPRAQMRDSKSPRYRRSLWSEGRNGEVGGWKSGREKGNRRRIPEGATHRGGRRLEHGRRDESDEASEQAKPTRFYEK